MLDIPQVIPPTESVLFPDGTFAAEVKIVITRDDTAPPMLPMKVKLALFACFEKGKQFVTIFTYHATQPKNNICVT